MKDHLHDKPMRVSSEDLEGIAREGVERALAARQRMSELTSEQLAQISGGAMLSPISAKLQFPIIAGGIFGPIDILGKPFGGQMAIPVLR